MEISTPNQDSLLPKINLENPRQIEISDMRKFFVAICAGKWTPAANGQPEWAFRALNEFCRCCGTGLRKKSLGYRGLKSGCSQTAESFVEPDWEQPGDGEDEFYEPDFVEFWKPTNLAELSIFLTRGKLVPLDLPVPDTGEEFYIRHTARAYLIFFIAWRELAALKTVPEIHGWLVSMKVIPKEADPRNTRTLLKCIGFPLTDKGGRPRKKNPTTALLKRPA
jgi:hypothetical protein